MKTQTIKQNLKECIKNNPQGFTADKKGNALKLINGYAVSVTNNRNKTINRLIDKIMTISKKVNYENFFYGGWYDENDKTFYLDITLIIDNLKIALQTAKKHNQKTIFNFKDMRDINLK